MTHKPRLHANRKPYPNSLTTFPVSGHSERPKSNVVLSSLTGDFLLRISAPLNESDRIGAVFFLHFYPDRQGNQNLHVVRHGGVTFGARNSGCSFVFWSMSSRHLKRTEAIMARQDLTPNQAISFLLDVCTALESLTQLPESELSAGSKILLNLLGQGVCSCAIVLDDFVPVEREGNYDA